MALAGQPSSTGPAPAMTLARHGHLRRHDLSLERRCELLRLGEPQPEVGQARLLATAQCARPLSPWSRRLAAPPPASHATPVSAPAQPLPVSPEFSPTL